MRQIVLATAGAIFGLSNLLKIVLGLVLHGYTTWLAYEISGVVAAIVTFLTPPIAEIFWIFKIWHHYGDFWSYLAIGSVLYIAMYAVLVVAASVVAAVDA